LRNSLIIATSALLVVAIGFGWKSVQSAGKAEATHAALIEQRAQLDTRILQVREQLAARQRDAISLQAEIKNVPAIKTDGQTAEANHPVGAKDPTTLIVSNPGLRALYLKSFRSNLPQRYGSIYQKLGLTQAQINKFEELATGQADSVLTLHAAELAQGSRLSEPDVAAREKQSNDHFYTAIADEVGATVSAQMIQLARLDDVQDWLVDSASFIPAGAQPLTGLQVSQLAQILASTSVSYQSGGNADRTSVNWDKVYAEADQRMSGLLSEPQIQNFKHAVEIQQFQNINEKILLGHSP
jgi:hypothetical protein